MRNVVQLSVVCSICACLIACVSSHDTEPGHKAKKAGAHDMKGDDSSDGDSEDDAKLTTGTGQISDNGDITFSLDATIPVGEEQFKCVYAQVPADRGVIAVPSVESHYTPGSHHLLVYRSDLTEVPEGETGTWDCNDAAWFSHARGDYYEAQQPNEHRQLPDGIAHKFQPGEVMILQSHYINFTDKDIDAHVEMTLHTMDVKDVKVEAGTIYFNNTNINIPPHSKASVSMSCPLPQDINLALLWAHMHKRGVNFVVSTTDEEAAEKLGTPIYEEANWSEPRAKEYPVGEEFELHAGTRITFGCDFQNDSDNTYKFGNSAETNEMCILHGMYWPRMSTISEQCVVGRMTTRSPM